MKTNVIVKIPTPLHLVVPVVEWAEFPRLRPRKRQPGGMAVTEADLKRFWSKVKIKSQNQCWNWNGSTSPRGYGSVSLYGANLRAHRVSLYFSGTIIPEQHFACHHCDNPGCVNPHHLFVGTQKQNADDMKHKNRQCKGERTPSSRITTKIARAIKTAPKYDGYLRDLAAFYGISHGCVQHVRYGHTWRHI